MNNKFTTLSIALLSYAAMHAQVGINTTDPKANLDVQGSPMEVTAPDGIIPPKLTRSQLIAKTAYGNDQKGALIYVTDLSGTPNTTTANVTTEGMYFFDGTLWQQLDAYKPTAHDVSTSGNTLTSTVDGNSYETELITDVTTTVSNNVLSTSVNGVSALPVNLISSNVLFVSDNSILDVLNGVVSNTVTVPNLYTTDGTLTGNRVVDMSNRRLAFNSTATSGTSHFNVDGATFNVDAVHNKVGIGTVTPVATLDVRSDAGSVTNPGEGFIGIGTTTTSAASAGAGAIRYTTADGGGLEYSNGTAWNTIEANIQKSIVIAKKTSAQTVGNNSTVNIVNWIEVNDLNGDYNPYTGVFTAPRTGSYVVSFSFNFAQGSINSNSQVEAHLIYVHGGSTNTVKSVVAFPVGGTAQAGAVVSFTVQLNSGETIRPAIWHSTGGNRTLRVPGSIYDDGFNNFSVVEL